MMIDEQISIAYREQVAGVAFCIEMHVPYFSLNLPVWYKVYGDSERWGRREIAPRIDTYDAAILLIRQEIRSFEAMIRAYFEAGR